jgi:glucose-6-phosphate-specific signal transduction histidine kinase
VHELRNNINQTLAASRVFLGEYIEGSDNRALVSKSYELTNEALSALTMLCINLHPAIITDLGFIEGIREYIAELKKSSPVQIHFIYNGSGIEKIDGKDKISIFRIIQNYLALVLKNPSTSQVSIELDYQYPLLKLTLSQNDPYFNFMKTGQAFDLNDINNRVTYLNGTIRHKQEGQFETSVVEFSLI